jgi:hypothetical protein
MRSGVTYVADGADLGATLELDVERESLDSTTGALKVLILEEHLLQLRVGLTNIAELIIPLVDGGIRQPGGGVAGLILSRCTADDGLILERDWIGPTSFLDAGEILRLLLFAGSGGVDGCIGRACVGHDAIEEREDLQ